MDKFKTYTDEKLVELFKHQQIAAFDEIYHRYWKRLYSMSYKRVQSREIAEELVQDIFTSLWASRHTATIGNLPAYLFTAIKYKVINHIAKEISRKNYSKTHLSISQEDNCTEETILLDDLNMALEREINKLPAKRQMIYRLHRKENLSLKQVASQLGISEKTVENQYGKAMKVLKLNLKHFTLFMLLASGAFPF